MKLRPAAVGLRSFALAPKPFVKPKLSWPTPGFSSVSSFQPANLNGSGIPTLTGKTNGPGGVSGTGSVTVTPEGGELSLGGSYRGLGATFKVKVGETSDVESADGFTTYTSRASVAVSIDVKVEGGIGGFGAGTTHGEETVFQTRVPDEVVPLIESGELPQPNPYDPYSLPVGGSIVLNSSDFESTRFSGRYRVLKVGTEVTETTEVSVKIDRVDETHVRVTVGPTEAIQNEFSVGAGFGKLSVGVGASKSQSNSHLETVEFDLSTPEGEAAYNQFLLDGTLPQTNSPPAITGVADIEIFQGTQSLSVNGRLGQVSAETVLASNEASTVVTTYPDGTKTVVTDASYEGVQVHIEQTFNGEEEDLSQFSATVTFPNMSVAQAELFYISLGKTPDEARVLARENEGAVSVTLNAEEAQNLMDRASTLDPDGTSDRPLIARLSLATSPYFAVMALAGGTVLTEAGGTHGPGGVAGNIGADLLFLSRGGGNSLPEPILAPSEETP